MLRARAGCTCSYEGQGPILLNQEEMGQFLNKEVGKHAASALAIVKAGAPRQFKRSPFLAHGVKSLGGILFRRGAYKLWQVYFYQ